MGNISGGKYEIPTPNITHFLETVFLHVIREPVKKSVENSTLGGGGPDRVIFHS